MLNVILVSSFGEKIIYVVNLGANYKTQFFPMACLILN